MKRNEVYPSCYYTTRINSAGQRVYAVIHQGMPICNDKRTHTEAEAAAKSYKLEPTDVWDGDTGEFTPIGEVAECTDCARWLDPLCLFPHGRCVDCHAKSPEAQHLLRTMTAATLAKMWGAA